MQLCTPMRGKYKKESEKAGWKLEAKTVDEKVKKERNLRISPDFFSLILDAFFFFSLFFTWSASER